MITTLAEVKKILNISDNSQDDQISALIPMVENDIVAYTNTQFTNSNITFSGSFVPTAAAGPVYTLVCALGGISAIPFAIGDQIKLFGTVRNDGRFSIKLLSDTVVTVNEPLVGEDAVTASITLIQYPVGLNLYAIRMISYLLKHGDDAGIQSESIKSYSYSRAASGSDAGYPAEILKGLDRYRLVKTGRGQIREQFIDRRGNYVGQVISPNDIRKGIL